MTYRILEFSLEKCYWLFDQTSKIRIFEVENSNFSTTVKNNTILLWIRILELLEFLEFSFRTFRILEFLLELLLEFSKDDFELLNVLNKFFS